MPLVACVSWAVSLRTCNPDEAHPISEYRLHPLLRKLGIPQCGLNAFRHTHASLMLLLGASPVVTQRQLWHTDPLTTMRNYAHVIGPEQRDAAEKVAGVLRPDVAKSTSDSEWTQ
jgi:integrase